MSSMSFNMGCGDRTGTGTPLKLRSIKGLKSGSARENSQRICDGFAGLFGFGTTFAQKRGSDACVYDKIKHRPTRTGGRVHLITDDRGDLGSTVAICAEAGCVEGLERPQVS